MSEDTTATVVRLLEDTESLLDETDPDDDPPSGLRELASDAAAVVEETEPAALLRAVGADESDESEPSTIVEALREGSPEEIARLRMLLTLSRLDDAWGTDDADDHLATLRELTDTEGATDRAGDEAEAASTGDEDGGETAGDGAEEDDDAGPMASLEAELQSHLSDSIGGFREELEAISEQVSASMADSESEADDDEDTDAESPTADEQPEEDEEDEDSFVTSSGMFSTVPPSNRPEMGSATRFSTLRQVRRRRSDE